MKTGGAGQEIVIALWLGVVGVTFFTSQVGVTLPMAGLSVLYSLFLVSSVVLVLVRVRQKGNNNHVE